MHFLKSWKPANNYSTRVKDYFLILITCNLFAGVSIAQSYTDHQQGMIDSSKSGLINVFLDFGGDREEYIRREINIVNYVRDPDQAQVHIMLSREDTGSGGRKYVITFLGSEKFTGVNDTLSHTFQKNDSRETQYAGLVKIIKIGLFSYITRLPMSESISEAYFNGGKLVDKVEDRWDFWVFNISADGEIEVEESKNSYNIDTDLSANRVTELMKLKLRLSVETEAGNYDVDGEDSYKSSKNAQSLNGLYVHSINEHFSAGVFGSVLSRTYDNFKLNVNVGPAIEYNLFPYSESIRRQFSFLYKLGYTNVAYKEETIYGKMKENLINHSLEINLRRQETWGTVSFSLTGASYFHDFSKNRLTLRGESSFRITEGLSISFDGRVGLVHDQLSLSAEGATEEEIYLNQKELASQFEARVWWGISYTFGSIYNNVVNTRFDH
jgi:hypothetical protein